MGISHSFDIDVAKIYGVNAAILLKYIGHWIDKNKANDKHFHDGNYWTYNSVKAFKELFPYMSEKVIRNTLKKLEDDGIIVTGNYNKAAYDRTTWYALTEKGKSICLFGKMEIDEMANGNLQKGEPIPDINTDIKSSNIEQLSSDDIKRIIEAWNELGLAKIIKIPKNTERYKSLSARVSEYSVEEVLQAIARIRKSRFLRGSNDKHWKISFDWLVKPNRFPRVLEGNYDDEEEDLF